MTNACFVDFDFPRQCGSWAILDIVSDVANASMRCIDSGTLTSKVLEPCDIVLGLESSIVAAFGGIAGPTYNSSGIGAIVQTQPGTKITGWEFLLPFSWSVWLVFVGCAIAAFGTQLLMRWLDFRRKKTSPAYVITEDEEKAFDLVMTSFTALINATRLYKYYRGPYFRHVASMVMAIFSVFFVSLYSSNLTAFMFPSSQTSLGIGAYDVHWALFDHADSLVPMGSSARVLKSASSASTAIIAPMVWLACDGIGMFIRLGGTVTYPVMYAKTYDPSDVSSHIASSLANETWPVSACVPHDPSATKLQFRNVWGLFAFSAVGYVAAVVMMLVRGPRKFEWFVKKSPIVNENDTLETVDQTVHNPCRKSEDNARVDMFELFTRSASANLPPN
jgi:hypothetical protein